MTKSKSEIEWNKIQKDMAEKYKNLTNEERMLWDLEQAEMTIQDIFTSMMEWRENNDLPKFIREKNKEFLDLLSLCRGNAQGAYDDLDAMIQEEE
jgi:hypothetical protein